MRLAKLGVGLAVLIVLASCSKQVAVDSSLTAAEQADLASALSSLEHTLKEKAPSVHSKLKPGADAAAISKLRSELGVKQIEALEMWYAWHNGGPDLMPLGYMHSIDDALSDRAFIGDIPLVDKLRKNAIKLLHDGAGDGYFLDISRTDPRVFHHMLEDPTPSYFGTLTDFVRYIESLYTSGTVSADESGKLIYDIDTWQKFESDYLSSP